MKTGSKINVANNDKQIFVGRDGIGFVFRLRDGALANRQSLHSAADCICVEESNGEWIVSEQRDIPTGAWSLAAKEFGNLRESYLGRSRRRAQTNSSYSSANSRGVVVRIWSMATGFVCDVHEWSNWEGDGSTQKDEATFGKLDEARQWAEKRCETRPSFGAVEWC